MLNYSATVFISPVVLIVLLHNSLNICIGNIILKLLYDYNIVYQIILLHNNYYTFNHIKMQFVVYE